MKLKNTYQYIGGDRWDWELYLEPESTDDLSDVESVQYILHPTFNNPVRQVSDSTGGFRLKSNGWGEFETKALVRMKNGRSVKLKHHLHLEYPDTDNNQP